MDREIYSPCARLSEITSLPSIIDWGMVDSSSGSNVTVTVNKSNIGNTIRMLKHLRFEVVR